MSELCSKIPAFCPFVGACSLQRPLNLRVASQTFREKRPQIRVTLLFFLVKKWNSEIGADSFVYFTVDEENCGMTAKQQPKGKRKLKERDQKYKAFNCTFSGATLSSQWPFYSNSFISNCLQKLTWFLIPGLPYILTLGHYKFYKRFYWYTYFVFFVGF